MAEDDDNDRIIVGNTVPPAERERILDFIGFTRDSWYRAILSDVVRSYSHFAVVARNTRFAYLHGRVLGSDTLGAAAVAAATLSCWGPSNALTAAYRLMIEEHRAGPPPQQEGSIWFRRSTTIMGVVGGVGLGIFVTWYFGEPTLPISSSVEESVDAVTDVVTEYISGQQ